MGDQENRLVDVLYVAPFTVSNSKSLLFSGTRSTLGLISSAVTDSFRIELHFIAINEPK
jgi:hypothetical protein